MRSNVACVPRARPVLAVLGVFALIPAAAQAATPRPDLAVVQPTVPVAALTIGASSTLVIPVRNHGRASAAPSRLGLYLSLDSRLSKDDARVGAVRTGRIRRGGRVTVRVRWTVPATISASRTYVLLACADTGRVVRESREGDNCRVLLRARPVSPTAVVLGPNATPPILSGPPSTQTPPVTPPPPVTGPQVGGCRILPAGNPWELDLTTTALDPDSASIITNEAGSVAPTARKLAVYGDADPAGGNGVPVNVAPAATPALPITYSSPPGFDAGPFPIAPDAKIEGWTTAQPDPPAIGLGRLVSVQQGTCRLTELGNAQRAYDQPSPPHVVTGLNADAGMSVDLNAPYARTAGQYGTTPAGVPELPGLLRQDELAAGAIEHALNVLLPRSLHAYVPPASTCGPPGSDLSLYLPMGGRLRLQATFSEAPYTGGTLALIRAMKRYGLMLTDRTGGPSMLLDGEPGAQLSDIAAQLTAHPVALSDFEVPALSGVSTAGC